MIDNLLLKLPNCRKGGEFFKREVLLLNEKWYLGGRKDAEQVRIDLYSSAPQGPKGHIYEK